jgi:DNA-binding MarR family transcriptional regulator
LSPVPPEAEDANVLDRLAREMVGALDQILDRMIEVAPAEQVDEGIPLTLQDVRALKAIPLTGSVSMTALASSMGISLPTATHLVDRLAAKGVVVRTRTEQDRRLVLVALSERSKAHRRAFFENRVALILGILEPYGPAEREQVVKAIGELARVVRSRVPGAARLTDSR